MFRSNRFALIILLLGIAALGYVEYANAHHEADEAAATE